MYIRRIMDVWDYICSTFTCGKVSVRSVFTSSLLAAATMRVFSLAQKCLVALIHDAAPLSSQLCLWPEAKATKPHARRTLSLACHRRRLFPSVGRPLVLTASVGQEWNSSLCTHPPSARFSKISFKLAHAERRRKRNACHEEDWVHSQKPYLLLHESGSFNKQSDDMLANV